MRTRDEIAARLKLPSDRIFDFGREVLIQYVSLPGFHPRSLERDDVLREMREYMNFAWEKVEDHRGLSASRSVDKFIAWVWVLGDEGVYEELVEMQERAYPQYGAPILKKVCKTYDFPIPSSVAIAAMAEGLPCEPGCQQGCGR